MGIVGYWRTEEERSEDISSKVFMFLFSTCMMPFFSLASAAYLSYCPDQIYAN
jgi:hypothetical protein